MSKISKIIIVLIVSLISSGICAIAASNIIAFGDSFSDGGNNGRYSDGALWLEILAEKLNLPAPQSSRLGGLNFAHSGAMSGSEDSLSTVNVGNQIKTYLDLNGGRANPDALYILWVGGNDFLDKRNPFDIIDNIVSHIEMLTDAGAKQFFVPNLPSLVHAPKGAEMIKEMVDASMEYFHDSLEPLVSSFINNTVHTSVYLYGTYLERELKSIGISRNVDIYYLDLFSVFNRILNDLKSYGVADKTELFYDDLHPNAKGHGLIANSASEVLQIK